MPRASAPAPRPALLQRFLGATDWLAEAAAALAAVALALLCLLILAEIAARNLFTTSLVISWEYAAYLMGLVFFFAAASALRHDVHVRVTLISEASSRRLRRGAETLATLLGLAIVAYLAYALGEKALESWQRGARSFSVVATPLWLPQAALLLGALVFALQLVARLIRLLFGLGDVGRPEAGAQDGDPAAPRNETDTP